MTARPIARILVANRGEIAVRVMRTCRERGLETVAVFSDVDRMARHVQMADRAVHIGPATAAQSYLDPEKLIQACLRSGADAVHPGYGFLSENADFAERCEQEGITFIGPPASAMRSMGSKTGARIAMQQAGVPVVPGDNGERGGGFPSAAAARRAADAIGFPVLIKASAGGGGKGMRLVEDARQFEQAFDGARREALAAFGDDVVYVEKAITRPRHVEIQVFADGHGNVVHLGERDCSIQRRHQKVIEEAPCPAVSASLRERMGQSAIAAARACGYVGAGTVEFLLADSGDYYFLEMNTRLQVEHPITEVLFGVDLVAWQLMVAAGQPLPLDQATLDARRHGAAIECRIYAEDSQRFMPSPGVITQLCEPSGPYVRVDSSVYDGSEVTVHYDPMIAKLIVWGSDRNEAIARMARALEEYVIRGIETNLVFHRRVMAHAGFLGGDYDTGFIARAQSLCAPSAAEGELLDVGLAAAGIARVSQSRGAAMAGGPEQVHNGPSPWRLAARTR